LANRRGHCEGTETCIIPRVRRLVSNPGSATTFVRRFRAAAKSTTHRPRLSAFESCHSPSSAVGPYKALGSYTSLY